jgi:hypothetical protein
MVVPDPGWDAGKNFLHGEKRRMHEGAWRRRILLPGGRIEYRTKISDPKASIGNIS